jgi:hypothetical protein
MFVYMHMQGLKVTLGLYPPFHMKNVLSASKGVRKYIKSMSLTLSLDY